MSTPIAAFGLDCRGHLEAARKRACILAIATAVAIAGCGTGPSAPTPGDPALGSDILEFVVPCPPSLLIGERGPCVAVARRRSGDALVSLQSSWSSTRPDVVAVDALGALTGRAAGEAVVSASYLGREGFAPVSVKAEDGLRVTAAAQQGDFRRGSTATMWLQGYYSVASQDTGRLRLSITDQTGTIAATPPLTVTRGGDSFLLSSTFTVPQTSTEVCRTAILEIGSVTLMEPTSNASGLRCVSIRP